MIRAGALALLILAPPQDAKDCDKAGGCCICKWTWQDRPYTGPMNNFITEKVWNDVKKVCWGEIARFECTEKPGKKEKFEQSKIKSPVFAKGLEAAKKEGKLVLFIGLTGG